MERSKAMVALSGGVDSAVAAALLLQDSWQVIAATMVLPAYGPDGVACRSLKREEAERDARRVAEALDIPLHTIDGRREFEDVVIADFCRAYADGLTPNPCVRCNQMLKFGRLMDEARRLAADCLVTGHYVGKEETAGQVALRKGVDSSEQSYFLYGLTPDQIRYARFPLADRTKPQVRALARQLRLPVHDRPKSQDLCFLTDGDYRPLLARCCPSALEPGPILHVSGKELGRHDGIGLFTVGQRRGLGIAHPEPLYVVQLDVDRNAVIVGEGRHLMREKISVSEINWMHTPRPSGPFPAQVKIRYNHVPAPAGLLPQADGSVTVEFRTPQKACCPGQSAVFYNESTVLGGGIIRPIPVGATV